MLSLSNHKPSVKLHPILRASLLLFLHDSILQFGILKLLLQVLSGKLAKKPVQLVDVWKFSQQYRLAVAGLFLILDFLYGQCSTNHQSISKYKPKMPILSFLFIIMSFHKLRTNGFLLNGFFWDASKSQIFTPFALNRSKGELIKVYSPIIFTNTRFLRLPSNSP